MIIILLHLYSAFREYFSALYNVITPDHWISGPHTSVHHLHSLGSIPTILHRSQSCVHAGQWQRKSHGLSAILTGTHLLLGEEWQM